MKAQTRFVKGCLILLVCIVISGCAGKPIIARFEAHPQRLEPGEVLELHYGYARAHDNAQINTYFSANNRPLLFQLHKGDQSDYETLTPTSGKWVYELQVENSHGSAYHTVFVDVWNKLKLINWGSNGTAFSPNQMIRLDYTFIGAEEAYVTEKIGSVTKNYPLDTKNGKRAFGLLQIPFVNPAEYALVIKNSFDPFIVSGVIKTKRKP